MNGTIAPKYLRFLVIVVLVLGIFFRLTNLDNKVYWGDETYSSLRIAGYKWGELTELFDGKEINSEDLQKYQRLTPEKNFADMIDSLAVEDPHHPPLYYGLGRFWMEWFGDSVAVRRSLSALLSLLAFPSVYWLCLELFESATIGWVAMAILAISPFHLLYAQEVREYSLWTAIILVSSAAFLRSMRVNTKLSWSIYAVTVALGFYTFLMSVFMTIAQGVYVFIIERFRFSHRVKAYLLAVAAALVLFSPWLIIVINNYKRIEVTNADKTAREPLVYLLQMWAAGLNNLFFDFPVGYQDPYAIRLNQPLTYLIPFTLVLVSYAIYFVCKNTDKKVWLFIVAWIGVPALILLGPDVFKGGTVSINSRYLTPVYLGIELAVAYLLGSKIVSQLGKEWQQKFWQVVMGILISGGVVSCIFVSRSDTSWIKYTDYFTPPITRIINQGQRPLLITDSPFRMLSFSYRLDPKVRIKVFDKNGQDISKLPDGFSDILLLNTYRVSSSKFREALVKQENVKLELVYRGELIFKDREVSLWKVNK